MGHLQESVQRMMQDDPPIHDVLVIPVGTIVLYHGRSGSMRQGRTEFPAMVLKQHPDDGSLDMIVFFEAEDMIWEQRVRPFSDLDQGHCWELVKPPADGATDMTSAFAELKKQVFGLRAQMYGEYNAPERSMIEYLDDFDRTLKAQAKRIEALEKSVRT